MKRQIPFTKMHGCGNDFIIIDNRKQDVQENELADFAKKVCERKFHIGANGLMLVEQSHQADFKMRYFNADGSEGEMCGNGARCIAKFAYDHGVAPETMTMETLDGLYKAQMMGPDQVQISFPDIAVADIYLLQKLAHHGNIETYHYVWAGVPHVVIFGENISAISDNDFAVWARKVKEHEHFNEFGTNVNLVEICPQTSTLNIRTYERGVEEETLACGSGATASAIIASLLHHSQAPVQLQTRGGMVTIHFEKDDDLVRDITLTGNAITVFTGKLKMEVEENEK